MRTEIESILNLFQKAYHKRDTTEIDQFMKVLNDDEGHLVIVGTSDSELCLDDLACKELFISDWKYWGFEKLKIDEANVIELYDLLVVDVPASFTYTFNNTEDKRQNYLNYLLSTLSETSDDKRGLHIKFSELNYELAHIYHTREQRPYSYRFDLRVNFIMNNHYQVKQIYFTVPDHMKRPASRIYPFSPFIRINNPLLRDKIPFINQLFENYFMLSKIHETFHCRNLMVINVDQQVAKNENELKSLIMFQKQYWNHIQISEVDFCEEHDDYKIVIARGTVSKTIPNVTYFDETRKEIIELSNSSLNLDEKILKSKQLIALAIKETSIGSDYHYPIRVQLVLTKHQDKWLISYMNLSYPFYYLLQDRNEFMHLI